MKNHPDVVCLQEHNQHSMVGDVAFLGGYDIYYAGDSDFLGICIIAKHDLQHVLAFNNPSGQWMIVQTCIRGEIYEFAGVYASQTSAIWAEMWDAIAAYS